MRKLLPLILTCFSFIVNGQQTQWAVAANSGLFSFAGSSSEEASRLNYNTSTNSGATNNPYGSKNEVGYGVSLHLQRVARNNFTYGIGVGYEHMESKILINGISGYNGSTTFENEATGETKLAYDFINLFPYAGMRLPLNQVAVQLTGGLDIAYCLKGKEEGQAREPNGTKYSTSVDRKTINMDLRPRAQIAVEFKNASPYIGYSYGVSNYKKGFVGGNSEAYSRILRFGIMYRLK